MKKVMRMLPVTLCFAACAFEVPDRVHAADRPKEKINEKDGAPMVWVPAGEFLMGSSGEDAYRDEQPRRRVFLDGYWIYKHPVTVARFRRFVAETGYEYNWDGARPAWGWIDTHPMVRVSWHEAKAYAGWAGVSLPTEAQWEKAARGGDGRLYPWGNEWDRARCNTNEGNRGHKRTSPVGAYPAGASPYGALDMAGNVWEWCADWYGADYYQNAPDHNPAGPETGKTRVLRGGGWRSVASLWNDAYNQRSAGRGHGAPHIDWINWIGFRCVAPMSGQELDE